MSQNTEDTEVHPEQKQTQLPVEKIGMRQRDKLFLAGAVIASLIIAPLFYYTINVYQHIHTFA